MGASLQCFPFIPPTHPQVPRERSSACPACCPSLSPSDQSQVLTGTLPLFPLPPNPLLPWNAPSQDWAKPCGPVPTHPPFPHIRDAGNAHFWVSIANTPLPKHPSCPVRHTRSPQPLLPPGVRPPPPIVRSPPDTTPACPLGPQPKTAAGSESSKEELVSQPLSWPILPFLAPPGPPPARRAFWWDQHQAEGCRRLGPGMRGQELPSSLNPRSRAFSAPWHRSARPQRSEDVSPGEQSPTIAILRGCWARPRGAQSRSLKVSSGTLQRMTGPGAPASLHLPSPLHLPVAGSSAQNIRRGQAVL